MKKTTTAAALIAFLTPPIGGHAQVIGGERLIEEITVTARKREETLQEVPFSIVAQTEETLRKTGAVTLEDVARNVAGFTVQNLGPGQSQVAIRGVSAGQIVRDQPGVKEQVGVYLDESVISLSLFTPDIDLYDMNRVEVLRGPQGTLFGSGSLSGTVRYITNQPRIGEFESHAESTLSLVDDGEEGGNIKGMVNLPVGDNAALRVAGYYRSDPGYIDAIQPDFSTEDDVNGADIWGVRAALRWEPLDALTLTPRIIYQDMDIDGFPRTDIFNILANEFTTTRPPVSIDDREQFIQLDEDFEDEFLLVDLNIEYDFGPVVLTSITSYTDRHILQVRDATQLTASITAQPDILDQPESVYTLDGPLDDDTDVEVWTQELRVTSNTASPLQWVAGLFYSDIERDYGQTLNVTGFEAATGIPTAGIIAGTDQLFFSRIPYDLEQFAIFGEGTYSITEQLDLTAGVRYYDFDEDRTLNFDGIFADQTIGLKGNTGSDGISPRFILSYAATDNIELNAQASKGFRLGGINDPLNEPLCSEDDLATFGGADTWDDEKLWNYEVGAKTTLFGGRGNFNIAVFYMDIEDLQATVTAGSCSSRIIFNVDDAESTGVEMEFAAQLTDNFDFAISASYIDAELNSTLTSTDAAGNVTIVGGIEDGNDLPTTPEFQFAGSATYVWPLGGTGWEAFATGVFQYVDERWTQFGDVNLGTVDMSITPIGDPNPTTFSFDPRLDDYHNLNLRVGARNEMWDLELFVNNVTDEDAELALDQERGTRARVGFLTNQPRTYGLTARVRF